MLQCFTKLQFQKIRNVSPSDCAALAESMSLYWKILNDVQILTSYSQTKASFFFQNLT